MSSKKDKMITGVFGIPVNDQQQLLLCQRNEPENEIAHKRWQFAGGGMEFGETPEETLIRELQEELTITPKILIPTPIVKTYVWDKKETNKAYSVHISLIFYLVSIGNQTPDITNNDENTGLGWFSIKQIEELDTLPTVEQAAKEALDLAKQML